MSQFFTNKNVLVAGGTGTIGISLVRQLVERGANVTVVSLDNRVYAKQALPSEVNFYHGDLTDFNTCLRGVYYKDVVFDMVGIKGSTRFNQTVYSKHLTSYLKFQTNLMDAASKEHVPYYLYAGSVCAYPQMTVPKREVEMWNGLPTQNDKYIGVVKRMGEIQAEAYFEDGTWDGVRIIRLASVYGPYDDFNPETAQVIPALIARTCANSDVSVDGDENIMRDFIFVDDAAYWAMEAVEKLPPVTPVNIGAGHVTSLREVCHAIQLVIPEARFTFNPSSYSGDLIRLLALDEAKKLLNYYERTSFFEGMAKTVKWYQNNKDISRLKEKFYG